MQICNRAVSLACTARYTWASTHPWHPSPPQRYVLLYLARAQSAQHREPHYWPCTGAVVACSVLLGRGPRKQAPVCCMIVRGGVWIRLRCACRFLRAQHTAAHKLMQRRIAQPNCESTKAPPPEAKSVSFCARNGWLGSETINSQANLKVALRLQLLPPHLPLSSQRKAMAPTDG